MIAALLILLIILSGLIVFGLLWSILVVDSVLHGHDLPTSRKATKNIIKIISESGSAQNFYDLGCAKGELAVRIKKHIPSIGVHGVDSNPIRIFFAKLGALIFRERVNFFVSNIFDVDLSRADIIYTYLWYDIMPELEKKVQKEAKPGTIIITNTSNFPNWKPILKLETWPEKYRQKLDFETLFVYKK